MYGTNTLLILIFTIKGILVVEDAKHSNIQQHQVRYSRNTRYDILPKRARGRKGFTRLVSSTSLTITITMASSWVCDVERVVGKQLSLVCGYHGVGKADDLL